MHYKEKLLEAYFSTHYQYIAPKDDKHWQWVIDLTRQSFGSAFSGLNSNAAILDAGCGVGYLEYYLLKEGFTHVDAVDISLEQINVAKAYLECHDSKNNGSIKFHRSNILQYLGSCSSYDVITAIDIIEHFTKDEAFSFLEMAYNALNDNGTIIVRVPNMDHPLRACSNFYQDFTHETPFTCASLKQCFLAVGFKDITIKFEKWPPFPSNNIVGRVKNKLEPLYYLFLGLLTRSSRNSFSPNIVGIGKKLK